MEDADYTNQLSDLLVEVQALNSKVDTIEAGIDGGAKDDAVTVTIIDKLESMDASLTAISENAGTAETVDYTAEFAQVKELVVYTDMILVVLVVVVVVLSGAVFGHEILSRLKVH